LSKPAQTHKCDDCTAVLCAECSNHHGRSKHSHTHRVVNLCEAPIAICITCETFFRVVEASSHSKHELTTLSHEIALAEEGEGIIAENRKRTLEVLRAKRWLDHDEHQDITVGKRDAALKLVTQLQESLGSQASGFKLHVLEFQRCWERQLVFTTEGSEAHTSACKSAMKAMAQARKFQILVPSICRFKRHAEQLEERLTCLRDSEQARARHGGDEPEPECDKLLLLEILTVYELILSVFSKIILLSRCTQV
jgi:hypothetical protein